jgi:hypothetical protein
MRTDNLLCSGNGALLLSLQHAALAQRTPSRPSVGSKALNSHLSDMPTIPTSGELQRGVSERQSIYGSNPMRLARNLSQ